MKSKKWEVISIALILCIALLLGVTISQYYKIYDYSQLVTKQETEINRLAEKLNERNWTDHWTKELLIQLADNNKQAYYVRNEIMYYNKDMTKEEASYQALWICNLSNDPYLTTAIFVQETNLIHMKNGGLVTSSKGAMGIGQLMPNTARIYGIDATIFEENVKGTTLFLADLQNMYDDIEGILGHYNGGSRPYEKIRDYEETRNFVASVSNIYNSMVEKYGGVI